MADTAYLRQAIALGLLASATAFYAPAQVLAASQPLVLQMNEARYLNLGATIVRIAVTNPSIADVQALSSSEINIMGLQKGTTSLMLWTADGMRYDYVVSVTPDDNGLALAIQRAINLPGVRVQMANGRVLLRGVVENQREKDMAFHIASLYVDNKSATAAKKTSSGSSNSIRTDVIDDLGLDADEELENPNIINLLELSNPEQINIEAQVIEIDSDDAKELGITYSGIYKNPSGTSTDGSAGSFYAGESYSGTRDKGSNWFTRNWLYTHFSQINAQIHALITNGRARVVSRPNVTTMSGKTAAILVGGEMPYQKKNNNGGTETEFKTYGIELKLVRPEVDSDGNITSRLLASVSRLDWANAVESDGFRMPALAKRAAETMVNIPSGMTMAIGGLLNSEDAKNITKLPLLGDIPILGNLFKYSNTTHNKSEIIILITPRVVDEGTPARMGSKMKETYETTRAQAKAMEQVDLNPSEPEPAENEAAPRQEESILGKYLRKPAAAQPEDSQNVAQEMAVDEQSRTEAAPAQEDNSILGKYLKK